MIRVMPNLPWAYILINTGLTVKELLELFSSLISIQAIPNAR